MNNKIYVFSMKGCNPCSALKQNIVQAGIETNIQFFDVAENMDMARQYNIRSVPTTLVLDEQGNVQQRISGNIQVTELQNLMTTVK